VTNQNKKDLFKFLVAGAFAVLLSKIEKAANKKAEDYFGPDELTAKAN
jgi:hypothetical protein